MATGVERRSYVASPNFGKNLIASTIVLLPGLEGTGTLFADLISEFPPSFTVVVGKYPPQRFLSYDELIPYVQQIVPSGTPFILVAESFSTPLAVKYAAMRPSNLVGLILSAGFITNPAGNWTLLARLLTRRLVLRISPPRWFLKRFVIGKNSPAPLEASFRQALEVPSADVLVERLRAVLSCDEREDLARTQVPMMYIQGERDGLVPEECFREIARIRPDVQLVSIPGAPHLVLQREPKKCAEAIVRFVEQCRC
jgi:pimeloyl-[acyl-carrier protein] methyl ester esterase